MMRLPCRIGLALVVLAAARPARADLIVAGDTDLAGTASMDLTLLPGTPFNPGPTPIVLDGVSGYGTITLHRAAEVGNTISIPTISGGMYYGSNPALGSYVFGNIAPLNGSDFPAEITNVVQDPGDPGYATGQPSSFKSGTFSIGGASFGFEFLTGPAAGITLFTDPSVPFGFTAAFDGLPPSQGTVLRNSGADVLNVLYNGVAVAQTSDRMIVLTAVPEPSSLALTGLAAAALGLARVRRHQALCKRGRLC